MAKLGKEVCGCLEARHSISGVTVMEARDMGTAWRILVGYEGGGYDEDQRYPRDGEECTRVCWTFSDLWHTLADLSDACYICIYPVFERLESDRKTWCEDHA
jgi:hypothetical protein